VRRELGVGVIVTGRMHQQGQSLLVSVALVDVRDGSELWGKHYDGKMDGILSLQNTIARDLAAHLRLRLTGEEERRLTTRGTENPAAFQLYLKGRYFWNKRGREGLEKAIDYFRQATDADPTYALAYAGLADVYVVFPDVLETRPSESFPKAKAAASRALEIDNQLAPPYATLGLLNMVHDWNWSEAERLFKRGIELDPNYATARQWYGQFLTGMGRFDEASAQYRRAQELEPLSLIVNAAAGKGQLYAGRPDAAIEQYHKTLELNPDFWVARLFLAQAYVEKGMHEKALAELQSVRQLSGGHTLPMALMGRVYAQTGRTTDAQNVIDELNTLSEQRYVPPCRLAVIYASLGDNRQALDWLEKAVDARSGFLRDVKVEPAYNGLHSEPRFKELLRQMGLSDKTAERKQGIQSVAVLPFQNLSGDQNLEYLSDGVADQIINNLSQVRPRDLRIRPFTSVSRYKGKDPDVPACARELNVQMIVTGKLLWQGDIVSISVAVVDVEEDNQFWGDTYRGTIASILDLQDQIARDVAAKLRLRLTGEEEQRLTRRYTDDPDAYLLYREALYHFYKFTREELEAGIESGKKAIQRDPNYALAYAAVARCCVLQGTLFEGPRKTFSEARRYLDEALRLDPNLPDAHSALGAIHLFEDWNWAEAERELHLAIHLDPNVILTRNILGFCQAAQGHLDEALDSMQRGQERDPLAAGRWNELAMCYNAMGRCDEAVAAAKRAIELDPNFFLAYSEWGTALSQTNQHDEAIRVLKMAVDRGKGHPRMRGLLGCAYVKAGKEAEARAELDALLSDSRFGSALGKARIYGTLGEKGQAFEWLHKACDERDSRVIWLKTDPALHTLRAEARFVELLKIMSLPP
jgi:tetratricopeptide (TPR) repeat protein